MKLDALVFDAYGTLFDVHSVATTADALFPGKGAALSQLWRTKQLEYTWQRSLMRRYADFNRVTRDALGFACEALQLPYSENALEQLNQAYRTLALFADARSALAALQGRVKLAILSNGAPDMLHAVVGHNGLAKTFDAVLSVDVVGIFKPDPSVYQLALDAFGCKPSAIGFVSSNGWDAAGAKAFGYTVFWVNRAGLPVDRLGAAPDRVIGDLGALTGLIAE